MNEFQNLLSETVDRLFADLATKEVGQAAEEGTWPEALWSALEENGLTRLMASEEAGGAGGSWSDALILLRAQGRYGAPIPLGETLVAGWLLSKAGLDVPDGPLTLLSDVTLSGKQGAWKLNGTAAHVPWGRKAVLGIALVQGPGDVPHIVSAPLAGLDMAEELNTAREPRDTIPFNDLSVQAASCDLPGNMEMWGALMRCGLMAGGLEYLLAQTVQYANERKQFGRPIGKFQAIQQQLAVLATQAAAAGAIAAHACDRASDGDNPAFEVGVAKTRIDEAVNISTSIAHQVHGAIGFTYEHGLHLVTRRLWSWRAEYGSGRTWAARLGRDAITRAQDADKSGSKSQGVEVDALWQYVTAR
ncbi:MAG: acyl-CoA dehydrogenase [Rhodobiaceae bacterium]|nr:MAG: acyl-CoA dehydrogenase [Rhodobiaceae bacterium]